MRFWGILISCGMLTACAVGKDYREPETKLDDWYVFNDVKHSSATIDEVDNRLWWQLFNDPVLEDIIQTSLARNNEIKGALARIAEARANERFENTKLLPQIDATGSATRGTVGGSLGERLDNSTRTGVSGQWELDIFGSNRRRREAADAGIDVAKADLDRIRLLLVSEVARNYIQLRNLQEQQRLTEMNIALQSKSLRITQAHRDVQFVSDLDVLRARSLLNTTRARLPQIKAAIYATINRLTVLQGRRIRQVIPLLQKHEPIPDISPAIVVDTPFSIIRNRPDVKVSERRLAQATALTAAAFADFFPKISLEGFFGNTTSSVFGSSNTWSATLGALFPLLNFGRLDALYDGADARRRQAFYAYKQSMLLAVEDVEVSFSNYLNEYDRQEALGASASEQSRAAFIAKEQYLAGIGQQIDLLDAQRNALEAELSFANSKALRAQYLIQLYTALGAPYKLGKPQISLPKTSIPADPRGQPAPRSGP